MAEERIRGKQVWLQRGSLLISQDEGLPDLWVVSWLAPDEAEPGWPGFTITSYGPFGSDMPTDRGHDAILKWWLERYGDKEEGLALPE